LFDQFVQDSLSKLAPSTIAQIKKSINHLRAYEAYSKLKITFKGITQEFYDKLTNYLIIEKNHSPNTIADVIKNLKMFLGKMTEVGINTNMAFRHKSFKKPSAPVDLIAMTQKEVDILFNLTFPGVPSFPKFATCLFLAA
jgi:translation initiation factor IF-2